MFKKMILKWLGLDEIVLTEQKVELIIENILEGRYDLNGNLSTSEDYWGKVDDLEWKVDEIREYDLSDFESLLKDHTSAIETLEERLDEIYSPDGYELTLTAKVKGVQNG
jgi:hypothetical protein